MLAGLPPLPFDVEELTAGLWKETFLAARR